MRVAFDTSVCRFDSGGTTTYVKELLGELRRIEEVELVEIGMHLDWKASNLLPRRARILLHDLAWIPRGSRHRARAAGVQILHGPAFRVAPSLSPMTTVT